ncbi:hypothetical protein HZA97_08375 [Candidatus Woesearchaeota archaeon]|nr:hypothetical protein [Candidatus Woesearchaeota archaeon]
MKKILWGISGIGTGHTHRQLPLMQHFSKKCKIVIFAYQESYKFYDKYFKNKKNISVLKIDIPFWAGNKKGLDFKATERINKNKDFLTINCKALAKAQKLLGKPNLVITDYEPLSAQYAYAYSVPLVTIDQQSKYLVGKFPESLGNQGYKDEIMRLRMFFPKADARIACSFFKVNKKQKEVLIFPSTLKKEIINLKRKKSQSKSILVYISSQREFVQSSNEIIKIFESRKETNFYVFTRNVASIKLKTSSNIHLYEHGDPIFYKILQECSGIISTAGHMLLSEAMYLGIPVYAIPLAVYEQQMNAHIINENKLGISNQKINTEKLNYFIKNLTRFEQNIKKDKKVLLRKPGQEKIIKFLENKFLR